MTAPIFIIGTERSGTNLLRLMLNCHSSIAVPHPPHIMKLFAPLESRYGDLNDDSRFRRMIGDVCRLVELHTYPWGISPDREQVFRSCGDRSLLHVYLQLYDQYLAHTGKRRWACKSTFMIEHVGEIVRCRPESRFILMVRDGRDVAVSAKTSIFNHYHVYYSARRWQREQRLGLEWIARLPAEQIMLLRYEELIADPDLTLRRLCAFLGEGYEEQMLEYHRSAEARKSGSLSISWQNTARPVISGNASKFRQRLSAREILQFEAICFREMRELGYRTDHPEQLLIRQQDLLTRERFSYRLAELGLKLKTELSHLVHDRNSMARLRKNLYMASIRTLRRTARAHV